MEILSEDQTSNEKKELCAVQLMRCMLEKHSEKNSIPFEEDFFRFSASPVYEALFDFDTGIWRDGPDYLESLYEQSLSQNAESA